MRNITLLILMLCTPALAGAVEYPVFDLAPKGETIATYNMDLSTLYRKQQTICIGDQCYQIPSQVVQSTPAPPVVSQPDRVSGSGPILLTTDVCPICGQPRMSWSSGTPAMRVRYFAPMMYYSSEPLTFTSSPSGRLQYSNDGVVYRRAPLRTFFRRLFN